MKLCHHCWVEKALDEFPANKANPDGKHSWCKECKNAHRRARTPEQKRADRQRWRSENREAYLAQKALQKAVSRGRVVKPDVCERCGGTPVHGHHADYSRRLDVAWLCPQCHGEEHAGWTWPAAA